MKHLFTISLFFFFIACQDDSSLPFEETNDEVLQIRSNPNIQYKPLSRPNNEILNRISSDLYSSGYINHLNNLQINKINWTYSIENNTSTSSLVSIPIMVNEDIKGILQCFDHEGQFIFNVVTASEIYSIVNSNTLPANKLKWLAITELQKVLIFGYRLNIESINNWIVNVVMDGDYVNLRDKSLQYQWGTYGVLPNGDKVYSEQHAIDVFIACESIVPVQPSDDEIVPTDAATDEGNSDGHIDRENIYPSLIDPTIVPDDCREKLTLDMIQHLDSYHFPCESTHQTMADAMSELCADSDPNATSMTFQVGDDDDDMIDPWDVERVTEGLGGIKVDPALKRGCPKINCILDNMIDGGLATSLIDRLCENFEEEGWGMPSLRIFPSDETNGNGYTTIDDGTVYMFLDVEDCENKNNFDIFETIQHELVHAEIFRDLQVLIGFNNSDEDDIDYYQALSLLAAAKYPDLPFLDQHVLMLQEYLGPMVESLIEMNGNPSPIPEGMYDMFEAFVLNGFGESPEVLEHMGYNLSELSTNAIDAINYIVSEGTIINETLLECQ